MCRHRKCLSHQMSTFELEIFTGLEIVHLHEFTYISTLIYFQCLYKASWHIMAHLFYQMTDIG